METLNLTMLLILNLFFMVFLLLAVCTVLVLAGVDEGFLYHDGQVELGGALAFVYTVCILIAVSMVVMIRMVFIHPLQRNIEAMKKLANGDFTVRVNHAEHGYVPREMVEFEQSFNKAAEELGGTEILRKDFINNFSHEFKTPIVSIQGFAKQLKKENLSEEKKQEYIDIIISESKRLTNLSSNILMLSKLENQQIITDKTSFSLDEQIRNCILLLEKQWTAKDISFDIDMQEIQYTTNAEMLSQVWVNIIGNAIKFSPEGSSIRVKLFKEGDVITAEITDRGIGMDQQTISHIFERFYQGDRAHASEGNGLGLPLVKRIVELCNGNIRVESQYGKGTNFIVTLPQNDK